MTAATKRKTTKKTTSRKKKTARSRLDYLAAKIPDDVFQRIIEDQCTYDQDGNPLGEIAKVAPINMKVAVFELQGDAPYVQLRFGEKARLEMIRQQMEGDDEKKKKKRLPKNFKALYDDAMYAGPGGQRGIPANAFRAAMISACKVVGFQMTKAKLCLFCVPDVFDDNEGTGLVKIVGRPKKVEHAVRLPNGSADIRVRAMWTKWSVKVLIRFDADMFSLSDITNLMVRVGVQVGLGEGRPDSRKSAGMGWGTFKVL